MIREHPSETVSATPSPMTAWLDLVAKHGPAHGVEWKDIEGKGPQFKIGHSSTGPAGPRYVDLDARLEAMNEQSVALHAMSLSRPRLAKARGSQAYRGEPA